MTARKFTVTQPTQIRFGVGAINDLAQAVQDLGGKKVLLVVDPNLKGVGLLGSITGPLDTSGVKYEIFDHVDPEPGLKLADEGTALAAKTGCDCVIGVGGGSAMDVAKAVSILLTNGGKAEDYLVSLTSLAGPKSHNGFRVALRLPVMTARVAYSAN